jgi:flagellar motor switch protein FliN/FliY
MNDETINNQENTEEILSDEAVLASLKDFGDIKLNLKVLVGKVYMPIENFLKITRGTIIEMGKDKEESFDLIVNDKHIALCEVFTEGEKILAEVTKLNQKKLF